MKLNIYVPSIDISKGTHYTHYTHWLVMVGSKNGFGHEFTIKSN